MMARGSSCVRASRRCCLLCTTRACVSESCARRAVPRCCVWFLFVKGKFTLRVSQSVISRSRPALPCTGSQSGSAAPVLTQVFRYFESTGKKTPGGAGTHKGDAGRGTRITQTNLTTIQTHQPTAVGRGPVESAEGTPWTPRAQRVRRGPQAC